MRRLRWPFFALLVGAGSQAGHLVAYLVRFGPEALVRQSQGSHAYFPNLAGGLISSLSACLLLGLLVVAVARIRLGRRRGLVASTPLPLIDLLAVLFTTQLVVYAGQEILEAVAAGTHPPGLMEIVFWGALGQLPAALLGVLALRWITVRLRAAAAELAAEPAPVRSWTAIPEPILPHAEPEAAARLAAALAVFVKRGPPGFLPVCA